MQEKRVFIKGEALIPVLLGLGARHDDFEHMRLVSNHLGKDPTVNYRNIGLGRFALDPKKQEDNYKCHDSGVARDFLPVGSTFQHNTVIQESVLNCNYFNLRTFTEKDIQGYPALKGVHQDGGDQTMIVLLRSENLRKDSGITFVHDNSETTGDSGYEAKPAFILDRLQHPHVLGTLMFADISYKHSVTPVHQSREEDRAVRDMLVLITRKPKLPGHPSKIMDSMESNRRLPLRLSLWLPGISHTPIATMRIGVRQSDLR
ncbi:Protein of unknown function DUF2257 [Penicillium concentricum]|uniref:Uncharacterized protein n=1 Tax=Penicillium concentricum TaxID=293559 RepID=A0A9W9S6Y4_9EURO|nr:Protein of unknown function DUF2257 [Penicillium concentricum]KAJ5372495.1 Protein of unknown function DUF2257 [Penicillium concentricum]